MVTGRNFFIIAVKNAGGFKGAKVDIKGMVGGYRLGVRECARTSRT